MKLWILFFVITFALMRSALAGDAALTLQRAEIAFANADFVEAATLARRATSAEGYAYAARAGLVYADFMAPRDERLDFVLKAEVDARRAIALEPELAEGHLQLAIALGFRGRMEGHMTAHFEGLAKDARTHLDYVIELEPNNPWAHALLGGWNLEIVDAGGFVGRTLYGASEEAGKAEYDRALELQPGHLVIIAQYALQLTALGGAQNRERASNLIAEIKVPDQPDALSLLTLRRLRELDVALASDNETQIAQVVQAHKGALVIQTPIVPDRSARPRHEIRPTIGLPR